MISLGVDEIHLRLTFYDEIDEDALHVYRALLSEDETKQELRFRFAKDRLQYVVTRTLVRTTLSQYAEVRPKEWRFSRNAYGRPKIANVDAISPELSFSISHTQGLIVLGITKHRSLGVDVENVRARKISIDTANYFFSRAEVSDLARVPPDQQVDRFFEYWTLKESYIKARGMGLSLPLDKFGFRYPRDNSVEIYIDPDLEDDAAGWQFWQFRPSADHLIAVCAERVSTQSKIVSITVVPMQTEEIFTPTFLRVSK